MEMPTLTMIPNVVRTMTQFWGKLGPHYKNIGGGGGILAPLAYYAYITGLGEAKLYWPGQLNRVYCSVGKCRFHNRFSKFKVCD